MSDYKVGQKWSDETGCCTATIKGGVRVDGEWHVVYSDKNANLHIQSADDFAEDYGKPVTAYKKGEIYSSDTGSLFFIVEDGAEGECVRVGNDKRYTAQFSDGTIESYKTRGLIFSKFEVGAYHFNRLKSALS